MREGRTGGGLRSERRHAVGRGSQPPGCLGEERARQREQPVQRPWGRGAGVFQEQPEGPCGWHKGRGRDVGEEIREMGGVEADSAMGKTWLLFSLQGVERVSDRKAKLYSVVTCL